MNKPVLPLILVIMICANVITFAQQILLFSVAESILTGSTETALLVQMNNSDGSANGIITVSDQKGLPMFYGLQIPKANINTSSNDKGETFFTIPNQNESGINVDVEYINQLVSCQL